MQFQIRLSLRRSIEMAEGLNMAESFERWRRQTEDGMMMATKSNTDSICHTNIVTRSTKTLLACCEHNKLQRR